VTLELLGKAHLTPDAQRARHEHPAEAVARPPSGRGRTVEDQPLIAVDRDQHDRRQQGANVLSPTELANGNRSTDRQIAKLADTEVA
jgi:hypothetical protein